MTNNFKLTLLSGVAAAAATMMSAGTANATFGMLPHCVGTVKCAMGGAGSGRGMAAVDATVNPAVSAQMGNEYQVNLGWFAANVDGQAQTNSGYGVGVGVGPKQSSSADSFPNGSLGVNYVIDDVRTFNLSIVPGGGGASKWATSRTSTSGAAASTTNDQEITYEMVYLQPSMSWKIDNNTSYGIGAILSRATMKTDSIYGNFTATANPNTKETFYGVGFQIGGVWQLPSIPNGSFALNYRSPVWHQNTGENYNNKVFNSPIDTPQQVTAGMTFNPIEKTTVAMDYKFVQWSGTETIGNWPDAATGTQPAGFGWVDQHILMLGVEHALDPSTRLRAGYSYGNSPIEEDNVFANFLFPAIIQHHFTVGGDFDLDEKSTVGFSAYITPEEKAVDNGTGGTYSGMGKGSYLTHQQYGFQLSYKNEF